MKFKSSSRKEWLNIFEYEEIHTLVSDEAGFLLLGEQRNFYMGPWRSGWYDINGDVIYMDETYEKWDMLKNKIMTILSLETLENS